MKLYTEEQVKQAMIAMHDVKFMDYTEKEIIDTLIPIDLPIGEEIDNASLIVASDRIEFIKGAKYVIDKIKGGNK